MRRWAANYNRLSPGCRARMTGECPARPRATSSHQTAPELAHPPCPSIAPAPPFYPPCRAVENDDIASSFSLQDLLFLHGLCGVPLVFDFHHHRFCPGELSEKEALLAAVKTWPAGVRPVVHWSESQVCGWLAVPPQRRAFQHQQGKEVTTARPVGNNASTCPAVPLLPLQEGRRQHAHSDYVRGPIVLHGLEGQVDVMIEAKCKASKQVCVGGAGAACVGGEHGVQHSTASWNVKAEHCTAQLCA